MISSFFFFLADSTHIQMTKRQNRHENNHNTKEGERKFQCKKQNKNKIGRSRTIGAGRNRQRITPKLFFNSLLFNWFPFLGFFFPFKFRIRWWRDFKKSWQDSNKLLFPCGQIDRRKKKNRRGRFSLLCGVVLFVLVIRKSTGSRGSRSVKVNVQPLAIAAVPHSGLFVLLCVRLSLLVHELSQADVSDAGRILAH